MPDEVFTRVDRLGAPRLVEYWEADPCQVGGIGVDFATAGNAGPQSAESAPDGSVVVEAQFDVGEYGIVILSSTDSDALETWLQGNGYNIPDGASEALAPYVAAGTKFFVANVNPAQVMYQDGQAVLSPLRIAYNSENFTLPIRLGLLNSPGTQDLIINILASSRYEVANYTNVLVPTNIRVRNQVRDEFAGFYEALFERAISETPNAVVTEYSWNASSCDPCPTEPLSQTDLATLGADEIFGLGATDPIATPFAGGFIDFTLTRLHYRYEPESVDEDLVFQEAPGIVGGRGVPDAEGELDQSVMTGGDFSNFQGRYVILHPWLDAMTCAEPFRGLWGGPEGMASPPMTQGTSNTALVGKAAVASDLEALIAEPIPVIAENPDVVVPPLEGEEAAVRRANSDGCAVGAGHLPNSVSYGWLASLGLIALLRRRRGRTPSWCAAATS